MLNWPRYYDNTRKTASCKLQWKMENLIVN